jgi:ubiquinone/menaquinone biosynthesis C-methylase UbiE
MDYDLTTMPQTYDAGRAYAPAVLDLWLQVIASAVTKDRIDDILDLGCGTGRYSAALAAHFNARVVGVDPSAKMLLEARRKGAAQVDLVHASGETLPLADGSIDMVFISMVFHHFESPQAAARECHRVLRDGGFVCLRVGATDRIDGYPFVKFFPSARYLIEKDLTTLEFIERTFCEAGLTLTRHQVVESEVAGSWSAYADKIAHRADSILAQMTDTEFAEGLAALRAYACSAPIDARVAESVDFFAFLRN